MPFDEDPADDRYEIDLCINEIKTLKAENEALKAEKDQTIKSYEEIVKTLSQGVLDKDAKITELQKQNQSLDDKRLESGRKNKIMFERITELEAALKSIKNHVEYSSPTGFKMSATWNIADTVLKKEDEQ